MSLEEALNVLRMFAQSQGFYGRLLRDREDDPEAFDNWLEGLAKDCKTSLDLILKIEC